MFVLPFDFGHHEQAIDQVVASALVSITRGRFVLDNVPTLEPARAVHRHKPTTDVTQQTKRSTDDSGPQLTSFDWSSTKIFQHLAHEAAVMPFFFFDRFYPGSFFGVGERMPVTAISISGCQLAGIRELQNID